MQSLVVPGSPLGDPEVPGKYFYPPKSPAKPLKLLGVLGALRVLRSPSDSLGTLWAKIRIPNNSPPFTNNGPLRCLKVPRLSFCLTRFGTPYKPCEFLKPCRAVALFEGDARSCNVYGRGTNIAETAGLGDS